MRAVALASAAFVLAACQSGEDVAALRDACHAAAELAGAELRPIPSGAHVGGETSDLEFIGNELSGRQVIAFFWEVERGHTDREVRCLTQGDQIVRLTVDGVVVQKAGAAMG